MLFAEVAQLGRSSAEQNESACLTGEEEHLFCLSDIANVAQLERKVYES
jgi:hypothetical protein